VLYTRHLKVRSGSSFAGGTMYAVSSAYCYRYSSFVGILPTCGGFALGPVSFHSWSHFAVADPFLELCSHIRSIRSARLFTLMSIKPHPPCFLGLCNVDNGNNE
jgi:hypothetical protein